MKMICSRCGKPIGDDTMYPIDPKGTPDRRWVHSRCMTVDEIDSIPSDVKDLVTLISEGTI